MKIMIGFLYTIWRQGLDWVVVMSNALTLLAESSRGGIGDEEE